MGWLDKAKNAASQAKEKVSSVDVAELSTKAKQISRNTYQKATKKTSQSYESAKQSITSIDATAMVDDVATTAKDLSLLGQETALGAYAQSKEKIDGIDWGEVTNIEYQKNNAAEYWRSSTDKLNQWARSTLEVDKDTMQMVSDLQGRLPVPAKTTDDIFTQCRNIAIQRATAAFFLTNTAANIDNDSAQKYENLSESYGEYNDRIGKNKLTAHESFAAMSNERSAAKNSFSTLENGYNKEAALYPHDSDIEHVIAKNEVYDSVLLRAGTKEDGLINAMNDEGNLVFTNSSVNRSKGAIPLAEFLEKSEPHPTKLGVRVVSINGELHEINEDDCNAALEKAQDAFTKHKTNAALEIGYTAAKTGATMAVQQVVGMIVVETIDIFMDEIRLFGKEFKLFDDKGAIQNVKELKERLHTRLDQRFKERQIWAKAKSLGIEAGVSGALSIIPQILISTITKLPAFTLGLIREGTLSCVRSARILASKDDNKLQSITIIMASTASAVVGLYVSRVISTGISAVPLLNRFNSQITAIISGLLVTAVPLVAIYIFDQNKAKLTFALNNKQPPITE